MGNCQALVQIHAHIPIKPKSHHFVAIVYEHFLFTKFSQCTLFIIFQIVWLTRVETLIYIFIT